MSVRVHAYVYVYATHITPAALEVDLAPCGGSAGVAAASRRIAGNTEISLSASAHLRPAPPSAAALKSSAACLTYAVTRVRYTV